MPSVLKNILTFTGLAVGVPSVLPHGLFVAGLGDVKPRFCAADTQGYTITADATNVTVTRGASAAAAVNVYCEYWHSYEDAQPLPSGIATSLFPFIVQGGGSGGGGGITALSGGTTLATGPVISFANGGNITFGFNGNTLTASVQTAGGTATGVGIIAGTTSAATGAVSFANSNNISFGMNASTVTASFSASIQPNPAISAAGASASNGTIVWSNSNNVSFGMAGSTITASASSPAETPFGISAGTQSVSTGTLIFSASNGLAFGMAGSSRITGSYSTLSFDNGGNITFGIVGSTITANGPGAGTAGGIAIAGAGGTITSGTASFRNSNGIFWTVNGQSVDVLRVATVSGTNGESVTMRASGAPLLIENVNSNISVLAAGAVIVSGGNGTLQAGNVLSASAANSFTLFAGQGALMSAASGNISILAPANNNSEGIVISAGQCVTVSAGVSLFLRGGTVLMSANQVDLNGTNNAALRGGGVTVSATNSLSLIGVDHISILASQTLFMGASEVRVQNNATGALGFFNAATAGRRTITGASTNATLIVNNLLAALASYGLISNGVT